MTLLPSRLRARLAIFLPTVNPMYTRTLPIMLALAIALTLIGPASAAQKARTTPDDAEILVVMTTPTRIVVTSTQEWVGSAATAMRQSLDAYFGRADGNLSEAEVSEIESASVRDISNGTLKFLDFEGREPRITNTTVHLLGAVGPVRSTEKLLVQHVVEADVPARDGVDGHMRITPLWNGTLEFTPAPGDVVRGGLVDGETTAKVKLVTGDAFTLDFGAPPPPATPTQPPTPVVQPTMTAEAAQESTSTPTPPTPKSPVPGVGLAGAVASLAVALMLASWRQKRV